MERSERALAFLGILAASLFACQTLIGIDKFKKDTNDCDFKDCSVPPDDSPNPMPDGDVFGDASIAKRWVGWPMPNPADAEVDANLALYSAPFEAGVDGGNILVVRDEITKLEWLREPPQQMTFLDASKWCEGLGANFRLPTRIELVSLWDYTQTLGRAFDTQAFGGGQGQYLTQSPLPDHTEVWVVDFSSGGSLAPLPLTEPANVRCVR